jgi:predicted ATPase/DNA-binding winged helix-turn-helix (wHTH) protein
LIERSRWRDLEWRGLGGMAKGIHVGHPEITQVFAFANIRIDATAHRLVRDGKEVALEPKAFAVMLEFLAHPGQLLSRDQLLDAVWGHSFVTPATLNRIIVQLRRALDDDSEHPRFIQTVHGLGYRFIAAFEDSAAMVAPTLRFAPPVRARLPERTGPLIGRGRGIGHLVELIRVNRLVTVAGPGGIGKTQAALEAARLSAADFPDGVWLFDCTPFTDGDGLVRWVAGMFDIRGTIDAEELTIGLSELLHPRRALLVFDNAERIAESLGTIIASLTAGSMDIHVLVTSQRRLNCIGETLYWLPSLETPPQDDWGNDQAVERLAQVPSVQLLLTRSRAFASGFGLTVANASCVAEICRRLDGIPLALELAAARLRLLSPEQLLARLGDRFLSLSEVNPNRPARHQTLHALIEWSFTLLSEREQALLSGLSVFAGACTLGGAEAIGAVLGFGEELTLEILGGLVDKSLLAVDVTTDPPSYRLLDIVRLFAKDRLADSTNEARVREAHLLHFVEFSRLANAEGLGERQPLWLERIRREWANLHIAFDYAIGDKKFAARALELTGNLCWYFRAHTDYLEPVALLERALCEVPEPSPVRAQALVAAGVLLHHSRKSEQAIKRLRQGIDLAQLQGNRWLAGAGQAICAFELAIQGDFSAAEDAVTASLEIADLLDDDWLRSNGLLSRGIGHSFNGRHAQAVSCMGDALAYVASSGDYFQRAYTQINLALQRFYIGDLRGAARDWLPCLDAFIRAQHMRGAAGVVEGTAYLAAERGDFPEAARFLAAAARMRRITGGPLVPQWREAQMIAEKKTNDAMGTEFERAQQSAVAARFEDVVGEARALLARIADAQPARADASNPSGS